MHITTLKVTIALVMGLSQNNYAHSNVIHAHMEAAMVDITREEAEKMAIAEAKKKGDDDLVVNKPLTEEYQFGWVIHMLPKKYMGTGVLDLSLFGIGFYIVTRDGVITHIPSSISPGLQ